MSHSSVFAIASAFAVLFAGAPTAHAQVAPVGTPFRAGALALGDVYFIAGECDDSVLEDGILAAGGSTLLVASAAGAPAFGSLFVPVDPLDPCPRFIARGVPPGTYWLLYVVGNTTVTSALPSDWSPLVVQASCIGPPGVPAVQTTVSGNSLTLRFIGTGCNWSHVEYRVGTSPGASDIGIFTTGGPQLGYTGVPGGQYYVRARAANAHGTSGWSLEQPIRVPACGMGDLLPQGPLNPTVTVGAGNVVTLSWSHTTLAWLTFHQLAMKTLNGDLIDTLVLPAGATSISAPVPPGTYRIGLFSGGPCGRSGVFTGDITFTVP